MAGVPCACLGEVVAEPRLIILETEGDEAASTPALVDASLAELKESWQRPFRW